MHRNYIGLPGPHSILSKLEIKTSLWCLYLKSPFCTFWKIHSYMYATSDYLSLWKKCRVNCGSLISTAWIIQPLSASKTYPEHIDGQLNLNQLEYMYKIYILGLLQELLSLRRERFKTAFDLMFRQVRGSTTIGSTVWFIVRFPMSLSYNTKWELINLLLTES